jgi:hypothetical protein
MARLDDQRAAFDMLSTAIGDEPQEVGDRRE